MAGYNESERLGGRAARAVQRPTSQYVCQQNLGVDSHEGTDGLHHVTSCDIHHVISCYNNCYTVLFTTGVGAVCNKYWMLHQTTGRFGG